MNRNDIVRMARKVGMEVTDDGFVSFDVFELKRFAALVAAHEREECAKVCEEVAKPYQVAGASVALECVEAIRGRGELK